MNPYDLLNIDVNADGSSTIKYLVTLGETPSKSVYLLRTLNPDETKQLIAMLSTVVDSYNKG